MTRYEQGFMNKCAEYGVDPVWLSGEMQKRAGVGSAVKKVLSVIKRFYTKPGVVSHTKEIGPWVNQTLNWEKYAPAAESMQRHINDVTHVGRDGLRWGRILATLGIPIAGGTAYAVSRGGDTPAAVPANTVTPASGGVSPAILAALGIGGAAAAGGGAYALSRRKKGKKGKKSNEDYKE